MKKTKDMIAVMQAFENGAEIECSLNSYANKIWKDTSNPAWEWHQFDYRVKQAPEYIPFTFEDWEIMVNEIVKHKTKPIIEKLTSFCDESVNAIFYNELLEEFTFLDGSPCGKLKQ